MRVYADTSVFGGCFDDEFNRPSRAFMQQVRGGTLSLQTSALVESELQAAPDEVRRCFEDALPWAEFLDISDAALALQEAYLAEAIVSPKWSADALHVALATVAGSDAIISWNFKHIVHHDKIARYHEANKKHGYGEIGIYSPSQVIAYDEEDL